MSIEKSNKKSCFCMGQILLYMLFHENFCRFSSQLNIYKMAFLRYNNTRRWAIVRRVPSFAHPDSIFCEMSIS